MRLANVRRVYGVFPQQINAKLEKIDSIPEKIDSIPEKIDSIPEKIETNAEKIDSVPEKIETNAEKITEKTSEQIRYRGQRGPDKRPRRLNQNSLRNLKPYQNLPVAQPSSDRWIWIFLVVVAVAVILLLIWIIYRRRKKRDTEND